MTAQVKICGLTTPEAIAATTQADFAGFIFYAPSPRHLSIEKAASLAISIRDRAVAVTVDAEDALLSAIVSQMKPAYIQLHGKEPPARVAAVRAMFCLPVIKAIGVSSKEDVHAAHVYEDVADMLLFDAKPAKGLPGGNGVAFDWKLLQGMRLQKPWFLSGGLTVDTVEEALKLTGAPMVDVSSSLESSQGIKNPMLVREFVKKAKEVKAES